ncbi:hypothetical protein BD413DRAFT_528451 [Trametes elegans]|nr:hypothetical protein BD413DRAFT_528451 [Trametes elegans]
MPNDVFQDHYLRGLQGQVGGQPSEFIVFPTGAASARPPGGSGHVYGNTPKPPGVQAASLTTLDGPRERSSHTISDLFPALPDSGVPPALKAMIHQITDARVEVAVERVLSRHGLGKGGGQEITPPKKNRQRVIAMIPRELKWAVWSEMHKLMGIELNHDQRSIGKKRHYTLPDPLPEGSEVRRNAKGDRLYNPEWDLPIDHGVNAHFVEAVKSLVQKNGGAHPHFLEDKILMDEELILLPTKRYFRSLKYQYHAENTERGRLARDVKLDRNKVNLRSSRKADNLRLGIPALEKVFGKAKTSGVQKIVRSPWQSEEHSSDGLAGPEREILRVRSGVSKAAWEVRHRAWRSRKLMLLYFVLAVFARFVHENNVEFGRGSHGRTPDAEDLAGDSDGGSSELSESSREDFIKRVSNSVATWSTVLADPRRTRDRFRGPGANHLQLPKTNRLQTELTEEGEGDRTLGSVAGTGAEGAGAEMLNMLGGEEP